MAWTGDHGLTLVERAPFGLIGAIIPSTNPTSTVICNSIGMIAAGNSVVFGPHPGAKVASQSMIQIMNRAITGAGGVLFGAVARGLAELGVKVASLDLRLNEARKTTDEIKAAGGTAMAIEIDVLKPESVTKAKDAVLAQFGRVDILINGAGGNHPKAVTKQEEGLFFLRPFGGRHPLHLRS